jgi:hypothetical protein
MRRRYLCGALIPGVPVAVDPARKLKLSSRLLIDSHRCDDTAIELEL